MHPDFSDRQHPDGTDEHLCRKQSFRYLCGKRRAGCDRIIQNIPGDQRLLLLGTGTVIYLPFYAAGTWKRLGTDGGRNHGTDHACHRSDHPGRTPGIYRCKFRKPAGMDRCVHPVGTGISHHYPENGSETDRDCPGYCSKVMASRYEYGKIPGHPSAFSLLPGWREV